MQLFSKTNIDFLSKRGTLVWVSLVLNIIGIVAPFALGLRFGIDFAGGTEIAVQLNASNKVGDLSRILIKYFIVSRLPCIYRLFSQATMDILLIFLLRDTLFNHSHFYFYLLQLFLSKILFVKKFKLKYKLYIMFEILPNL